eukprot:CAMPEP_0171074006 /NCGR_PEP_ID=MMETSP0766_2-20121228/11867_1 /TAXON_ID=439317 /ORGANISM="Gambierdiscus australes, Strain CAWD 149" /LENGTH=61 /DNA_ID=CAMNT_0011530749 /DNA_START=256 /DNA_END=441 /DNA_ORIENTATION=+
MTSLSLCLALSRLSNSGGKCVSASCGRSTSLTSPKGTTWQPEPAKLWSGVKEMCCSRSSMT